jgi:hypothetical protein
MSEEMKLLMALCDALGFAVEVERDYCERKVTGEQASKINGSIDYPGLSGLGLKSKPGEMGMLERDNQGMYTTLLVEPKTSYKLTPLTCNPGDSPLE